MEVAVSLYRTVVRTRLSPISIRFVNFAFWPITYRGVELILNASRRVVVRRRDYSIARASLNRVRYRGDAVKWDDP